MTRVVIMQEYVPAYRAPFFMKLEDRCSAAGIDLVVGAGEPSGLQNSRADNAATLPFVQHVAQRQVNIRGRRITRRALPRAAKNCDLLIVEQARRNLDAYTFLLPRSLWPAPRVAMWGHGRDYVLKRSAIEKWLSASLTRRVDHFFAYTQGGAEHVRRLGVNPASVTVVHNSIDTEELSSDISRITPAMLEQFRRRHSLTERTVLHLGALDSSKRVDFLLTSFRQARTHDPGLTLLVAGEGVQADLVAKAAACEDSGVVQIGRVTGETKALALFASVALAVPGRVGLVAVDSIASRRPIITTDWPFHAPEFEYVTPGRSAFVSENSVAAYAEELVAVTNRPDRLQAARRDLQALAPTVSVDNMADNFFAGIIRALGGTSESGA